VGFANLLFIARLALGEAPVLEQELRKKLAGNPLDYVAEMELQDALAAQDKAPEALKVCDDFVRLCQSRYGSDGDQLVSAVRYHVYYAIGDFEKLKIAAMKDQSAAGRIVMAMALVEQGKIDDAAKALPQEMDSDDRELFCFVLAIAYRQTGNETAATQWRSRGVELLQHGNQEETEAAGLFTRGVPPTRADAEGVTVPPELKAVILTVLSQDFPQARAELAEFARQMNVGRGFPCHILRRATAKAL
jgi:hypothetical protein